MYRPDKNCKLCWKEFETEYTDKVVWDHWANRNKKVVFAEFTPCLHRMVCKGCAMNKKYTECPFCSEPIEQARCKEAFAWDYYRGRPNHCEWRQNILYPNSN